MISLEVTQRDIDVARELCRRGYADQNDYHTTPASIALSRYVKYVVSDRGSYFQGVNVTGRLVYRLVYFYYHPAAYPSIAGRLLYEACHSVRFLDEVWRSVKPYTLHLREPG